MSKRYPVGNELTSDRLDLRAVEMRANGTEFYGPCGDCQALLAVLREALVSLDDVQERLNRLGIQAALAGVTYDHASQYAAIERALAVFTKVRDE